MDHIPSFQGIALLIVWLLWIVHCSLLIVHCWIVHCGFYRCWFYRCWFYLCWVYLCWVYNYELYIGNMINTGWFDIFQPIKKTLTFVFCLFFMFATGTSPTCRSIATCSSTRGCGGNGRCWWCMLVVPGTRDVTVSTDPNIKQHTWITLGVVTRAFVVLCLFDVWLTNTIKLLVDVSLTGTGPARLCPRSASSTCWKRTKGWNRWSKQWTKIWWRCWQNCKKAGPLTTRWWITLFFVFCEWLFLCTTEHLTQLYKDRHTSFYVCVVYSSKHLCFWLYCSLRWMLSDRAGGVSGRPRQRHGCKGDVENGILDRKNPWGL